MSTEPYAKAEVIDLTKHSEFNEKWVQGQIAKDPTLLGLGEVILKDRERPQLRAGRLDLLLQDVESGRRYEVELQLGKTDESHIIRAVEYWDIERKRYPQYEHCAVLIAEDITSRFLNVISLFHGSIPLVAIKMQAIRIAGHISLVFTAVLDEMPRGLVDEDEDGHQAASRNYWEGWSDALRVIDATFAVVKEVRPHAELNYTKGYIGIAENGITNNFVHFIPRRKSVLFNVHLPQSEAVTQEIAAADIETLPYEKTYGNYRLSSRPSERPHRPSWPRSTRRWPQRPRHRSRCSRWLRRAPCPGCRAGRAGRRPPLVAHGCRGEASGRASLTYLLVCSDRHREPPTRLP